MGAGNIDPKSKTGDRTLSERVYDLKERTFKFAQRILDIVEQLPKNPHGVNVMSFVRGTTIKATGGVR